MLVITESENFKTIECRRRMISFQYIPIKGWRREMEKVEERRKKMESK